MTVPMTVKECTEQAECAINAGRLAEGEALLQRAEAIKAGPAALARFERQADLPIYAAEYIKALRADARANERIDRAMQSAIKADRLAEIDPAAAKLADELHGGNYAQASYDKQRAYVKYLKGVPREELGGADRTVVLSPAQILECVRMGWSAAEIKATLIVSQDSLGGFLVSGAVSDQILGRAASLSVVRQRSTIDQVPAGFGSVGFLAWQGSGDVYPTALHGYWTSEIQSLTGLEENPRISLVKPPIGLWRLKISVSKTAFEDSGPRFVPSINAKIAETIAVEEDRAELVGTGVDEPIGLLLQQSAGVLVNADIRVTNSGNPTAITADGVIGMIYSLPGQYRSAPGFAVTCKAATVKQLRLLRDDSGRYLFDDRDHTLLGYPLAESESMPTIAVDAFPLACGDFSGHCIADRVGLSIDRYDDSATSDTDSVVLYVRRRLGNAYAEGYRFAALKVAA